MSILRTHNLQNPDSSSINIVMDQGGNTNITGVTTVGSNFHVTSGSVGIGTDNPGTKLDVRGGNWSNGDIVVGQTGNAGRINFRRGVDGSDAAYLGYDGATNNSQVALAVNSGDGTILFKTNSTERLRITSSGAIGIGNDGSIGLYTQTNDRNLILGTGSGSSGIQVHSSTSGWGGLYFGDTTSGTARYSGAVEYNHTNNYLRFFTNQVERLRITSAGNVGIGTDNPGDLLTLYGTDPSIKLQDSSGDAFSLIEGDNTDEGSLRFRADPLGAGSGTHIRFDTDGTERLRIGSGGGHKITCAEGYYAANLTECNDGRIALNINQTRSGQTKAIAIGAVSGNSVTGIQCYDTSNNSANNLILNPFGGNMGLGTNNPTDKLSIVAAPNSLVLGAKDSTRGNHIFQLLADDSAGNGELRLYQNTASGTHLKTVEIASSGNSYLTAGNFGVGTATPGSKLTVYESGGNAKLQLQRSNTANNTDDYGSVLWRSSGGTAVGAINVARETAENNGYMFFQTATGGSMVERLRITSAGHKWTNNGSIFHGSNDVTDFTDAARDSYNNVSIRAGYPGGDTSPTNRTSAIKIYPAGSRNTTTGTLTGGIAWQHLDPNNGAWGSTYGEGAQIWMGAALHDTPGQERDRFNLWMNSGTTGNSQPGNLAIEAYPNGVVRHPKVPAFMVRHTTGSGWASANAVATWNTIILNNGNHWDSSNNRWTAPIDGIYHFTCQMLSQNNSRLFHHLRLNGTRVDGTRTESYQGTSYQTNTFVATINMSANDNVDVYVGNNGAYGGIYSNFNGFLIG